ncbi:MAG: hypothetical protein HY758_02210 [Nitrospirae bacterium]|nr:hypothetical protein [Nitrospirota bacterium]
MKDQNGKQVFSKTREYEVYDFHFEHNKEGYLGLNNWDITAMDHIYDALEPGQPESFTYVVPLAAGTKSVTIEATYRYVYDKDLKADIQQASKKVEFP